MTAAASLLRLFPPLHRAARAVRYRLGGWPEAELALLPLLVDPARIAIDIGAHAGLYTCALRPLARSVVAFEPNRASAGALARLCPSARIVEAAASDRCGTTALRIPRGDRGRATVAPENALAGFVSETIPVRTVTLDGAIDEPVGFIKIDVEGHELEVLAGARRILERDRPALLVEVEERHRPGATRDVPALLQKLGYRALVFDPPLLRALDGFDPARDQPCGDRHAKTRYLNNFIFLPRLG